MKKLKILFVAVLSVISFALNAQQLAFPGAEGFGKYATGGRAGTVYHVTNLDDSGPGSFRDAVSQSNRIVVFDVGGVINIGDRIVIHKNVTVAGQTAPGGGITIYGNGVACNDDSGNSIIRYIRIRMGKNGDYRKDALGISAGTDYIFDHVSVTWGWDGTVDINGTGIDRITMQDCIIGQGIDIVGHSTGGLFETGSKSIIRTLWIDNETRNPKAKGPQEFINSVIYNWGADGYIMGGTTALSECNLIGSYFIAGPSSSASNYVTRTTPEFHLYADDNWFDGNKDGVLNGRELIPASDFKTATMESTPFSHPGVNTILSASDALNHVIDHAGASIVRDEVDKLLIEELVSFGTKGAIIHDEDDNGIDGGVGTVASGSVPLDTDNDGMSDAWEDANGLDKNVDDAMTISGNGYANIENYINSLIETIASLKYPKNLQVTSIGESEVTLTWVNEEESATEVVVEYGKASNSLDQSVTLAGDATTVIVTGLLSNTEYFFRAMVKNDTMQSGYSSIVSAKTPEAAIPPVSCINSSPADESTIGFIEDIILSWENTTSILGGTLFYTVYFGTSESNMEEVSLHQHHNSYNAGNLQPGTTYYWRIKTSNSLGYDEGTTWSFTTGSALRSKVLYIPFDEASGTLADNQESTFDATAKEFTPSWVEGIQNNAIQFSASPTTSAMVVDHYDDLSMGISPFTISLWFKSDGGGISDTYLLHKGTHSVDYGTLGTGKWIGIQYQSGSRLTFGIDDNNTKSVIDLGSPDQYFNNEWHNIVCMRDVTVDKIKMYMDGEKVLEGADNTGDISELAPFVIGNCNYNFDTPFKGLLDELEVYDDLLTDAEIEYLYNKNIVSRREVKLEKKSLQLYPNPFSDRITLNLPWEGEKSFSIRILDLNGRVLYNRDFIKHSSHIELESIGDLAPGFYFCVLNADSGNYTGKIVKK